MNHITINTDNQFQAKGQGDIKTYFWTRVIGEYFKCACTAGILQIGRRSQPEHGIIQDDCCPHTNGVEIGRSVCQGCCKSPILWGVVCHSSTRKHPKIHSCRKINTIKYAGNLNIVQDGGRARIESYMLKENTTRK